MPAEAGWAYASGASVVVVVVPTSTGGATAYEPC